MTATRSRESADSGSQFGIVLPTHRACVAVTAHYQGPTTDILDAIWSTIVPALAR